MARCRVALVALTSSLLAAFARPAWTAPEGSCGGWSVVASPNEGEAGRLHAVAAVSAIDVWAVGESQNRSTVRGLTEHWNGTSWTIVPSSYPQQDSELRGVAAASSSDVWAVGFSLGLSPYRTFAEHWDGTSWSRVPTPNRASIHNYLTAVTAVSSTDVWAVGFTQAPHASTERTLIEHWDGSSWSIVESPNPGPKLDENELLAVDALAPNDIWAVGYYRGSTDLNDHTLIEHWDGASWSIVGSPDADVNNKLYGVGTVGASDVWAVGESFDVNPGSTLIEHWNGSAWSVVPSPAPGSSSVLRAVAAVSSGDVWALGGTAEVGIFPTDTLAEHWNGSAWSVAPTPPSPDSNDSFNGAGAISSNDVWGVGIAQPLNDLTLTEHYCP